MYGIYDGSKVIARFVVPMTMRSNRPVFASDTLSLKRQTAYQGAQRWELTTQLEPLSHTAEDLFVNFVVSGHAETVQIIVPQNYGVIRKRTSTAIPSAIGSAGATSVSVSLNSGIIPRGTFVQFAGHTKVYMATTELVGNGTLGVYPPLIEDVQSEIMKHRDDLIMPCVYDTTVVSGMVYNDGILMDNGTITLLEKL